MENQDVSARTRMNKLTELWQQSSDDVAKRGATITAKNGYICSNPSVKMLLSLNTQIEKLKWQVENEERLNKQKKPFRQMMEGP